MLEKPLERLLFACRWLLALLMGVLDRMSFAGHRPH
jgi:hypothetical protein